MEIVLSALRGDLGERNLGFPEDCRLHVARFWCRCRGSLLVRRHKNISSFSGKYDLAGSEFKIWPANYDLEVDNLERKQNVALKNEIERNKCKILAQKKYKSTTATNPTVLQASRKVAKPGEACQEALLKLCVKKIFIEMA